MPNRSACVCAAIAGYFSHVPVSASQDWGCVFSLSQRLQWEPCFYPRRYSGLCKISKFTLLGPKSQFSCSAPVSWWAVCLSRSFQGWSKDIVLEGDLPHAYKMKGWESVVEELMLEPREKFFQGSFWIFEAPMRNGERNVGRKVCGSRSLVRNGFCNFVSSTGWKGQNWKYKL